MYVLSDAAAKLRVSKSLLRAWDKKGSIQCVSSQNGKQKVLCITAPELQRIKQLMYPYGMPDNGAYPLDRTTISYLVGGQIKVGWLAHLVEWGFLKGGFTPSGLLVINDDQRVIDALNRLSDVDEAFLLCAEHPAKTPDIVRKVKSLVEAHMQPPD